MKKPQKHLLVIYLLMGLVPLTLVVLVIVWLSSRPSETATSSKVLLRDNFNQEKPGQIIEKNLVWENLSPLITNNEAKIKSHWFYSLNKVYHEPYVPADYTIDPKLFVGTLIVAGETNWSNYIFQARAEPLDEEGFGLVFRFQDINNFYSLVIVKDKKNEGPYVRILQKLAGKVKTVASVNQGINFHGNYDIGDWYRLKIIARASKVEVQVNSKSILNFNDDSLMQGKIGLWAWEQSGVFFDDVLVTKLGN